MLGVNPKHLYEDQASGKREDRLGLAACLNALREGETLAVWKLDRLGRDPRHLINTVHDLTTRGVGLKVLTGREAAIQLFAALAEFELISDHQQVTPAPIFSPIGRIGYDLLLRQ